jgi:hypothetical protein
VLSHTRWVHAVVFQLLLHHRKLEALGNTIVEPITTFHDSTHAKQRSRERNISLEAMKDVVKYHQSKTQQYRGDHGGFVYKFKKTADGKTLAVVAEVKKASVGS